MTVMDSINIWFSLKFFRIKYLLSLQNAVHLFANTLLANSIITQKTN